MFPLIPLWNNNFSLPRPIEHTFPIAALMHCAKIWQRALVILYPAERDDACVGATEQIYTQHFDAVILEGAALLAICACEMSLEGGH